MNIVYQHEYKIEIENKKFEKALDRESFIRLASRNRKLSHVLFIFRKNYRQVKEKKGGFTYRPGGIYHALALVRE